MKLRTPELLTPLEHEVLKMLGEVANKFFEIVGHGASREADINEVLPLIHGLQNMILANAGGRAYPELYRVMGDYSIKCNECGNISNSGEGHNVGCSRLRVV